jgi:hypothetical protein
VRIDIYGPSRCNYFVAKAAAKSIDNAITLFFGQPKEIRLHNRWTEKNTFNDAIKSHYQHRASIQSISIDAEPDAEVFWFVHADRVPTLPFTPKRAISMVKDKIVRSWGISAAKFCEVYGWQVGDVLECNDEPIVLKIETIDQSTGTVYGGRCNEFQQDFGTVQEIFPDFRFRKVEL